MVTFPYIQVKNNIYMGMPFIHEQHKQVLLICYMLESYSRDYQKYTKKLDTYSQLIKKRGFQKEDQKM